MTGTVHRTPPGTTAHPSPVDTNRAGPVTDTMSDRPAVEACFPRLRTWVTTLTWLAPATRATRGRVTARPGGAGTAVVDVVPEPLRVVVALVVVVVELVVP